MLKITVTVIAALQFLSFNAQALTQSSIVGTILDDTGIAVGGAHVKAFTPEKKLVREVSSGMAGDFEIYPLEFGDYTLRVESPGYRFFSAEVHIASGITAQVPVQLVSETSTHASEMTITVKAKKNLVNGSATSSSREVSREMIQKLPQGDDVKLPKLLATTTPGIVQGPFGQTFIRGNHANIQYQIDGVQLPDSPSNTFGQAFSPRNIDHMEVITGGIPAEYGERLAAVVNIITRTGSETPGGNAQIGYGAYNTLTPQMNYSGSTPSGRLHYYLSAGYNRTDRGLDTPQPESSTNVTHGTSEAIHDHSHGTDEFVKLDWQASNDDKVSFMLYNAYNFFEIPNFPSSYAPSNPIFNQGYSDQFGNGPLNYVPAGTNDTQAENNAYGQVVWKHAFAAHSFLQLAPYYKFSKIKVTNDPVNDLYSANAGAIPGSNPSSFSENRDTHNVGLKGDYSQRLNERNLVKAGFQLQDSLSKGPITVISQTQGSAPLESSDRSVNRGYLESVYVQDEITLAKPLTLNLGVRFDATQYKFSDVSTSDSWVQPRLGLSYMATETTKLHLFYGLLFQPAPIENLRNTFVNTGAGNQLAFYDIKAEKDHYYEVGVSQQLGTHVMNLNTYYKRAKNMLDDSQLLNTSIAQPYNFAEGYAYGAELSITGKIDEEWTDYFNYSYEIAKGNGISGGLFSFPAGTSPNTGADQFLDHVQVHTANAGVTYKKDSWWCSGQALYGSGLRTGDNNTLSLPGHLTADANIGYDFSRASWWSKTKLSLDVLNILDNRYAITIANGFNGSHYAAGRQLFLRLSKEL